MRIHKSTETEKTSIDLDADTIAKLKAILKISGEGPVELFLNEFLGDMVRREPIKGFLLDSDNPRTTPAAKEKVTRINAGDRRLVHPQPIARNATIHPENMERLTKVCGNAGMTVWLNAMLTSVLDDIESGNRHLVIAGEKYSPHN